MYGEIKMENFAVVNTEEIKTKMLELLERYDFLPVEIFIRDKRYMVTLGLHRLGFPEFIISLDQIDSVAASDLMHRFVNIVLETPEFSQLSKSEHLLIKDYFIDLEDSSCKADLVGNKVHDQLTKEFMPLTLIVFGNIDIPLFQLFLPDDLRKIPTDKDYDFIGNPQTVINALETILNDGVYINDRDTVSDVAFTMRPTNTVH
jgi:hypothetical protein